ncbi:hypothetical protein [Sphingobacterium sp. HMA12]|uniref:hypothetical protein n=1 Tax=Sphingobacterium sp. HMA12 TaxID=2050894 RepID=UPI000CE9B2BE|nr:hypothetical protein [Sphingobacterium sp. HMA12]
MNVFFKRVWEFLKTILFNIFEAKPYQSELQLIEDAQRRYEAENIMKKNRLVAFFVSYFPDNYTIDQSLLDEIYGTDGYCLQLHDVYRVLSKSKKVLCPRKPLVAKNKYSYYMWRVTQDTALDIPLMFSTHQCLEEVEEETEELSLANADILILGSGGSEFFFNELLSTIDLTHKYVVICSSFSKKLLAEIVLYRVDKDIYPDELWNEKICHEFIDEIIREATTIHLKV